MRYSIRTSSYSKRITLYDPIHEISIADLVAIIVEILRIDSGCFMETEFTKLIHMNS